MIVCLVLALFLGCEAFSKKKKVEKTTPKAFDDEHLPDIDSDEIEDEADEKQTSKEFVWESKRKWTPVALQERALNNVTVQREMEIWFKNKTTATLLKHARQGNLAAAGMLGVRYSTGKEHTRIDPHLGVLWYKRAAENGMIESMVSLANSYMRGAGIDQNETEAIRLLKLAAEEGQLPLAEFALGNCYEHGRGVEKDLTTAFKYYKQSSEHGSEQGTAALQKFQNQYRMAVTDEFGQEIAIPEEYAPAFNREAKSESSEEEKPITTESNVDSTKEL
jgi:TPR repeat protein